MTLTRFGGHRPRRSRLGRRPGWVVGDGACRAGAAAQGEHRVAHRPGSCARPPPIFVRETMRRAASASSRTTGRLRRETAVPTGRGVPVRVVRLAAPAPHSGRSPTASCSSRSATSTTSPAAPTGRRAQGQLRRRKCEWAASGWARLMHRNGLVGINPPPASRHDHRNPVSTKPGQGQTEVEHTENRPMAPPSGGPRRVWTPPATSSHHAAGRTRGEDGMELASIARSGMHRGASGYARPQRC
jgi:hypothetical protein